MVHRLNNVNNSSHSNKATERIDRDSTGVKLDDNSLHQKVSSSHQKITHLENSLSSFEDFMIQSSTILDYSGNKVMARKGKLNSHQSKAFPVSLSPNSCPSYALKSNPFHVVPIDALTKLNHVQVSINGSPRYLDWQVDTRNRMYHKPQAINFQGDSLQRSAYTLTNLKPLDSSGVFWTKVSMANALGFDKLPREERVETIDRLIANSMLPDTAFMAQCLEALSGKPTGLLVSVDATSSVIQILSLLDPNEAELRACNVIGNDTPKSPYMGVVERMSGYDKLPYSEVKSALMTALYGSSREPSNVFGLPIKSARGFALEAINEVFTGAINSMLEIESSWIDKATFNWTLPNGSTCEIKRSIIDTFDIQLFGGTVDEKNFKYSISSHKADGDFKHLVANVVQSLDAYICSEIVVNTDAEILTVHDAFYSHPNDIDLIMDSARNVYASLVLNCPLEAILKEINPSHDYTMDVISTKERIRLSKLILEAEYLLN